MYGVSKLKTQGGVASNILISFIRYNLILKYRNYCIAAFDVFTENVSLSGTWGYTKKEQSEIDLTHRRQLRTFINNNKICNNKLYEKCKEEEISVTIKTNKWKLFGHILGLPLNTLANESMKYYFKVPEKIKKYP